MQTDLFPFLLLDVCLYSVYISDSKRIDSKFITAKLCYIQSVKDHAKGPRHREH